MLDYDNDRKNPVRALALTKRVPGWVRAAVLLPSDKCICLLKAIEDGIIHPRHTHLLCIEHNPGKAVVIQKRLKALGFRHSWVYCGEVEKLTREKMEAFFGDTKVEYAFLDFCGQLTTEIAEWLASECRTLFAKKAMVAFTFATQVRKPNNRLLKRLAASGLFYCLEDAGDWQVESRFQYPRVMSDLQGTVAGIWAMLAINYDLSVTHVRGYTSHRTPMVMVKTRINAVKRALDPKYAVDLLYNHLPQEPVEQSSTCLNCHPAMSKALRAKYLLQARKGIRPPWMKPQVWSWHSMNPYGIRAAA